MPANSHNVSVIYGAGPTPTSTSTVVTGTPPPAQTGTALPSATSTPTASPSPQAETPPANGASSNLAFLPLIRMEPTATPQPTAVLTWQRLGTTGGQHAALALVGSSLLVAVRGATSPGIYRADVTACTTPNFQASFNPRWTEAPVYDITANQSTVLAGTEEKAVLHSGDGGTTWTRTNSDIEHRVFAVALANGNFYAGSEDDSANNAQTGIFKSMNGGGAWQQIVNSPKIINRLRPTQDSLWIGTKRDCSWQLNINDDTLTRLCDGLPTNAAREVHDIAVDEMNDRVYLATADGVYAGDGRGAWERFGLQNIPIRSLTRVDQTLYAGTNAGSVTSRNLATSTQWAPIASFSSGTVRDFLYDSTHCRTLLVATDDGVWILR